MTEQALKNQDSHFMELAIRQAEIAVKEGQMPFGAVVVNKNGELIAEGHNAVRSERDPAAHGEIVAIRNAWHHLGEWDLLANCTIYSSCEPCLMCTFIITQVGFSRVVFAARGSDIPSYRPLLGSDLSKVAKWVNAQSDWKHLEVVGDFMREKALETIAAFPWANAETRSHEK
jgi:tRNA(adenine34) deaminase